MKYSLDELKIEVKQTKSPCNRDLDEWFKKMKNKNEMSKTQEKLSWNGFKKEKLRKIPF